MSDLGPAKAATEARAASHGHHLGDWHPRKWGLGERAQCARCGAFASVECLPTGQWVPAGVAVNGPCPGVRRATDPGARTKHPPRDLSPQEIDRRYQHALARLRSKRRESETA